MSLRVKIVLISVFLCLALGATVFAAVATFQDYQVFKQQNAYAANNDVRSIRSWMTIPYIAHFYHVPESYLYQSLHISGSTLPQHLSLHFLATRYNRSDDTLIHTIQAAIQTYRKQHPTKHKTTGQPHAVPRDSSTSRKEQVFDSGCYTCKNMTTVPGTERMAA